MWCLVSDFFHLEWYFPGSFMFYNRSVLPIFFFFMSEFHCIYTPQLIYPFIPWLTVWSFLPLTTVNITTRNIRVQAIVWISVFSSFRYIPRSRIVGHIVNLCLTFWRTTKTIFHSGCIIFYHHEHRVRFPIFPYSCQYLLFSLFVYNYSMGYEVISHCGFNLHFFND